MTTQALSEMVKPSTMPPTYTPSSTGSTLNPPKSATQSQLPPGIEDIINRKSPKSSTSVGSSSNGGTRVGSGTSQQNVPKPQTSIVGLIDKDNVDLPESKPFTREDVIHRVKAGSQSLRQISDDMHKIIKEYFPSRLMVRLIEMPAFKGLRKAFTDYITVLEYLMKSLSSNPYFDNKNLRYLMYQIGQPLDAVIDEGSGLVGVWNRREGGQVVGKPLTGKNWTFRRIVIHDSNSTLEDLTKMVENGQAVVLKELGLRQSLSAEMIKLGQGLLRSRWMRLGSQAPGVSDEAMDPELDSEESSEPSGGTTRVGTESTLSD